MKSGMHIHTHVCQYPPCAIEFQAKRSDAKFCGEACKKADQRLRKKEEEQREEAKRQKEAPIRKEIADLAEVNAALSRVINGKEQPKKVIMPPTLRLGKSKEQIKLEVEIADWEKALTLNDTRFYNVLLNPQITFLMPKLPEGASWVDFIQGSKRTREVIEQVLEHWVYIFEPEEDAAFRQHVAQAKLKIPAIIADLKEKLQRLKDIADAANPRLPLKYTYMIWKKLDELKAMLAENTQKLAVLNENLKTLHAQETKAATSNTARPNPQPLRIKPKGTGFSPSELRKMQFDLLDLAGQGELGAFLGDLEKSMLAIALIGDAGAGKSYFSFRLSKLFLDIGLSVCYFSLEEGVNRLTSEKLDNVAIQDDEAFEVVGKGGLTEIKQAAKKFNVVVVDSWSILDEKPEAYQGLREEFPDTIFVCIFQKTTTGTIRGGSKIIFDTPVCMNVYLKGRERLVEMQKSRYGTQGWVYSISEGLVVFDGSVGE